MVLWMTPTLSDTKRQCTVLKLLVLRDMVAVMILLSKMPMMSVLAAPANNTLPTPQQHKLLIHLKKVGQTSATTVNHVYQCDNSNFITKQIYIAPN